MFRRIQVRICEVPVNDFLNDQNGMFVQHKHQILPKEEKENATFPLVRPLF